MILLHSGFTTLILHTLDMWKMETKHKCLQGIYKLMERGNVKEEAGND
jgi:hypothetical protein